MLNLIDEGITTHVKRITEEEELQLIDEEMQLVDAEAQLIDAVDDVDLRMQSTCQRHMTFKRSKWILRKCPQYRQTTRMPSRIRIGPGPCSQSTVVQRVT